MRTIRDYRPEVVSLLNTLKANGCQVLAVSNGDDWMRAETMTGEQMVEEILGADEAWLDVRTPTSSNRKSVYLVFGNEPGELVCDYALDSTLDKATQEHAGRWENTKQRMREV